MQIKPKLPPRPFECPNYGTVPLANKDLRRYTTDQEFIKKYQTLKKECRDSKKQSSCKQSSSVRANTAEKQEQQRQQHVQSLSEQSLMKVKSQAQPQFENFSRVNHKNHNFITQQNRKEKPHSFKQLLNEGVQISNLYYVCDLQQAILNQKNQTSELFREHIQMSYTYIPMIQQLKIDQQQLIDKHLNIPISKNKKYNKTIIFDMDETLIHCNEDENHQCQMKLPIEFEDGEIIIAGINFRNFAREILYKLSELCEVIVFTASQDIYANKVINILDPNNKLTYRIFRESCISVGDNYLIKHLGVINRDLKNLVLIDNSSYSFAHNLENGIPIISFYNDEKDNQLIKLYRYLCQYILPANDVRPIILQHFKQDQLSKYASVEEAVQNLYF